jgi:hypothetical protein
MPDVFPVAAKLQALNGILISGNAYRIAAFNGSFSTATTIYSATNEVTGTNWPAGGVTLSGLSTASSGTTAYGDFADVSQASVTISGVRYLVIYDDTDNDEIRGIYDLGSDYAATNGTVQITFPTASASLAIIRIG